MAENKNFIDTLTKGAGAKYLAIAFGIGIIMSSIYFGSSSNYFVFNSWANGSLSSVGCIITLFSTLLFLYKHDKESFSKLTSTLSSSSPVSPTS
jgi:hypothetical protein